MLCNNMQLLNCSGLDLECQGLDLDVCILGLVVYGLGLELCDFINISALTASLAFSRPTKLGFYSLKTFLLSRLRCNQKMLFACTT